MAEVLIESGNGGEEAGEVMLYLRNETGAHQTNGYHMNDEKDSNISKFKVPVIDLTDFEGPGISKIRDEIGKACESFGFFMVENHGVDLKLMKKFLEACRGFFDLTEEEKREYLRTEETFQGYGYPNMEIRGMKGSPSPHMFYITYPMSKRREDLWPRNPLEFREVLRQYAEEVKLLGEKLLSVISTALGLPPNTLLEKFEGPSGEPVNVIRPIYYSASGTEELKVGLGWHADPGGITLLQATSSGTQIKIKDEWIIVESLPNAFCVNIGDQIEILTNGRFKSVEHRGLAIRDRERITIPFFSTLLLKMLSNL